MGAKRPLLMTLIAAVLFLVATFQVSADRNQQQQPIFRSSAQTVPIYATVTDGSGRLVPDLSKDDFEVYDEGKKVELALFENAIQPITVVVMLDTSGSMTMNLELLKQAATQFVIRLLPEDRAKVGSFSDKIIVGPPEFTGDRDELMRILREDIQFGNPTALWDATDVSMNALDGESGRRVVLIFTDGADTYSQKRQGDILTRARAEEFMIYAIGLRSAMRGQGVSRPDPGLKKVAEETGGGYFELRRTDELNATFTRVAAELHSQYVLGFTPEALDGKVHKLEVKVTRPGLTSRARKSYVAK